jgi:type IV pilus assembly protein PilV
MNSILRVRRLPSASFRLNQQGFGLIEVLVALLILAIGLLGMASLQSTGMQMTSETQARTQAILLADDLIERARANLDNLDQYSVDAGDPPDCDTGFTIDNGDVADDDLADWRNALSCLLPGGDGDVEIDGEVITVLVTWNVREDNEDLDDGELELEVEL